MLVPKDAYPGFIDTVNSATHYPMVDLLMSIAEVLKAIEERYLDKQHALVPDDGQHYQF